MSEDKPHIQWFSFEGKFVCDYHTFFYGCSSQTTIEAMVPSHVLRGTVNKIQCDITIGDR